MTYNLPHAGAGASPHDDAGARRRPRRQRAPDAAAEAGPDLALGHAGLGLGHHIFLLDQDTSVITVARTDCLFRFIVC